MNIPNRITVSRILLIPLIILILSLPIDLGEWTLFTTTIPANHGIAAIIFIIASGTDWLDGYYARRYNLITNLGKFLDPLADKLLVSTALILLVQLDLLAAWIVIIIISREFAVTGLRVVAASEGVVLAASPLGKIKTATQLIAITLLLLHNFPFQIWNIRIDLIMIYVALFFTVLSGYDYFIKNKHVFKESS